MHCINNFSSLRSPILNNFARELWAWALLRNVHLKATYIPGVRNTEADALSRASEDEHSYSIHEAVSEKLQEKYGCFDVDLFADSTNYYKVGVYVSWLKDTFAAAKDAFFIRWDTWRNLYAFPPFKLVDRCLSHLDEFGECELTLICTLWPTQPSGTTRHDTRIRKPPARSRWRIAPCATFTTGSLEARAPQSPL